MTLKQRLNNVLWFLIYCNLTQSWGLYKNATLLQRPSKDHNAKITLKQHLIIVLVSFTNVIHSKKAVCKNILETLLQPPSHIHNVKDDIKVTSQRCFVILNRPTRTISKSTYRYNVVSTSISHSWRLELTKKFRTDIRHCVWRILYDPYIKSVLQASFW